MNDNDKNRNNKNNNTGETPVRRMGKMPMPRTTATPYQSPADEILRKQLLAQIERHRCDDGGFSQFGHAATGTAYGCFLAMGAYQELAGTDTAAGQMDGVPRSGGPCPPYLLRCLQSLRTTDGAYANEPGQAVGMTSATAAASIVLRQLNQPSPPGVADWLLARREQDGFLASPAALMPDLLSTATGLHALAGMGIPTATMAEPVSAFVTSLLCEDGGFRGNWLEHNSDCEYTFYALLALGSVSSAGITDIKK